VNSVILKMGYPVALCAAQRNVRSIFGRLRDLSRIYSASSWIVSVGHIGKALSEPSSLYLEICVIFDCRLLMLIV